MNSSSFLSLRKLSLTQSSPLQFVGKRTTNIQSFGLKNSTFYVQRNNFWSQVKAKRAVIFKNGYGMISSNMELPLDKSTAEIEMPPSAIPETLWLKSSSDKLSIASVNTVKSDGEEEEYCTSIAQILQANMKQVVEVQVENNQWHIGRIASVQLSSNTEGEEDFNNQIPSMKNLLNGSSSNVVEKLLDGLVQAINKQTYPKGLLQLQSEKGSIILNVNKITAIKLPVHPPPEFRSSDSEEKDQVLQTLLMKHLQKPHLQVNYNVKTKSTEVEYANFSYLSKGIYWRPQYKINVNFPTKTATLALNSNLINKAEDIYMEELVCSSGNPVLTLNEAITDTIEEGRVSYKFKDVSVNKNESTSLPVFNVDLPFKEMYIGDFENVYRSIRLQNTTEQAWTKGVALIEKDGTFIGQNELMFTPVGKHTDIKIAKSKEVKVSMNRDVQSTDRSTMMNGKQYYQVITHKERATVTNSKSVPIHFVMTCSFKGVSTNAGGGNLEMNATEDGLHNESTITWEFELKPSETKEMSHTYNVYQ